MSGTVQTWIFFIALFIASGFVGVWLQNIYNERGK
jgi:hypothetical protein